MGQGTHLFALYSFEGPCMTSYSMYTHAMATRQLGSTKPLVYGAIIGPVLFTLAWMILGSMRAGYSFISQPISGLGVGPNAVVMNGAFVVMGVLLIVGVVGVFQTLPAMTRVGRWSSGVLLALSGLGAILCGLFTFESLRLHLLGVALATAPIIGFLVAGLALRRTWLIVASPLTLVLTIVTGATFDIPMVEAGRGIAGLTERIAVLEIHAVYIALAWLAIRANKVARAHKGPAMEGFIAEWYAKNTKGDARGYQECAKSVAERVPSGGRVLEVATGPGYLAIELAKLGQHQVFGLDISKTFVRIASDNARAEHVSIDFREGNAAALPYENESFDFVVCRAAFKNFTDPNGALDEIHRVLKPGGKASIFDLRNDASKEDIKVLVDGMRLSGLSSFWTKLTFRFFLLKNAHTRSALERMAGESRFGGGELLTSGVEFDLRLAKPSS